MKEWQRQMFGKEMPDMFTYSRKQNVVSIESEIKQSKEKKDKPTEYKTEYKTVIYETVKIPNISNNDTGFNGFGGGSSGGGGASGSW